jgi:hypothetical protein
MRAKKEPANDRSLDKILSQWVVDTLLPPRFQERVWQRIERAETQAVAPFWASFTRFLESILPRQRLAYSYAAILLVVAVAAGAWGAQAQNSRTQASLESRYLRSVDPYQGGSHNR